MQTQFCLVHQPLISTKFNEFKIQSLKLYLMTVLPSAIACRQLHWIPVKQCIHFKIATLTYRTLQSASPSYLLSLINFNNPPRPLRSFSLNLLHVPFTTKAIGHKAFHFIAPTVWNSIPQNIMLLPANGSFKCSLKTHLASIISMFFGCR